MDDLGRRLVEAELLTEDALANAAAQEGPLAVALVQGGLAEDTLLSFLKGEGHVVADPAAVLGPDRDVGTLISAEMARRLCVLPLRDTADGLEVAMADPSARHTLRELALSSGRQILPRVAPVSALLQAIPTDAAGRGRLNLDDADLRAPTRASQPSPWKSSTRTGSGKLSAGGTRASEPPKKRFSKPPGLEAKRITVPPAATFSPPSVPSAAELSAPPVSEPVDPEDVSEVEIGAESTEIVLSDSWDVLDADTGESLDSVAPIPLTRAATGRAESVSVPGDIGTTVARMRTLRDRDAVLDLASEAALLVARSVVFLTMRGDVLRGWSGRGGSLTPDAVRNLWIPTGVPSMFRFVVQQRKSYAGSYGETAADNLFRAATGSRGGTIVICGIEVMGKMVALLAADDVGYGREGRERIETIAEAAGDAFKRLILAKKS